MSADEDTKSLSRGIRIDLVIAVCALLISTLATAASWWQSRVVADQLSSQVWPYLSLTTTFDPNDVSLDIINNGLGPAIIRSVVLTVDGKPHADPATIMRLLIPVRKGPIRSQVSSLTAGSVIRAGGDVRLFRVIAPWLVPEFGANAKRFDIRLCYCSLLAKCWFTTLQGIGDPQPVPRCDPAGDDQLRVLPGRGTL